MAKLWLVITLFIACSRALPSWLWPDWGSSDTDGTSIFIVFMTFCLVSVIGPTLIVDGDLESNTIILSISDTATPAWTAHVKTRDLWDSIYPQQCGSSHQALFSCIDTDCNNMVGGSGNSSSGSSAKQVNMQLHLTCQNCIQQARFSKDDDNKYGKWTYSLSASDCSDAQDINSVSSWNIVSGGD